MLGRFAYIENLSGIAIIMFALGVSDLGDMGGLITLQKKFKIELGIPGKGLGRQ